MELSDLVSVLVLRVFNCEQFAKGDRPKCVGRRCTRPHKTPRFEGSLRATFTVRMIVAIIRPDMLEAVKESLDPSEFRMIVSEVKVREAREKVTQIYPSGSTMKTLATWPL